MRKKAVLQRQRGFVLLSLVAFLFVAALLALGDMRTLAVQQTLVVSHYAAQNAMVETESALATMEQFAAFEGSELGKEGGNARLTTLSNSFTSSTCNNNTISEPAATACIKRSCNSFLYPKGSVTGDDNVSGGATTGTVRQLRIGTDATECSFCPPPTPACKARWDEAPDAENTPWAEFPVNFYETATTGAAPSNPTSSVYSTKNFYGMVEYLGWAQCNLTDMDPTGTNLDAYSGFLAEADDQTRGCRVMRVTVRNQPPKASLPTITLQSTLLVASVLNYPTGTYNKDTPNCCLLANASQPASSISKNQARYEWPGFSGAIDAERISWRQIFPN